MKRIVLAVWLGAVIAPCFAWGKCPVPLTSSADDFGKAISITKLHGYFQCNPADPVNDLSPCNAFVGKAIEALYGLNDFKTSTGGYLLANDIADSLAAGFKNWKALGVVYDKDNTYCAQSLANKGYPIVAAMSAPGHGHVAIVLPGSPSQSSTWGMAVPNSASFLLGNVASSYVGKGLGSAFSHDKAKMAVFYYKEIRPF